MSNLLDCPGCGADEIWTPRCAGCGETVTVCAECDEIIRGCWCGDCEEGATFYDE